MHRMMVWRDLIYEAYAGSPEPPLARSRSWRPEVIADSSGKWIPNGLRFATKAEAEANVRALSWRWFAVRETRVVESDDPVNYKWVDGGLQEVKQLDPT